jgi:hypothetical protein
MKDSDLTGANVTWAAGGSVSTVSFKGNGIETRSNVRGRRGGGIRGDVQGFSRASRRNLLRRLAAIDRASFEASGGRALFVTLTYPHAWPDDPEACKWHLKAFRKRLQRRYGPFAAFWRLGVQGRGAWHFHLLLFVGPSFGAVGDARRFVARAWYEICGEVSEGHLRAGTQVQELRSWKKATSYAERYLAKREVFPEGVTTGRVWGVWDESLLPVRWQTAEVSARDAHKVRRAYGRLAGRKGAGPSHRLTVFVDHETVARLLAFLGYRPEGSEAPRDRLNSSKREFAHHGPLPPYRAERRRGS